MNTNLPNIPPINPPFWCFSGHIHTIACSLFGNNRLPACEHIEIPTPDDDFLELDVLKQASSGAVIVLFHGLEGSASRYYIAGLMKKLQASGYSAVAVNFRSCGLRLNRQARFYHSGATDDYDTVFKWVQKRFSGQAIGSVGFSLGANALIKSLGEKGNAHLSAVNVAVSAPYDLKMGSIRLGKGFNRLYDYRFVRTLKKKLSQKRKHYPELPQFSGSTLYEFDDQVTSVIHGFNNADHYYEVCSSKNFLSRVGKPTLLIHSRQDPLCPVEALPLEEVKNNAYLDYIISEKGGHVGFWDKSGDWLNTIIVNYLSEKLD